MAQATTNTAILQVVRIRETQEDDIEVTAAADSREAAKLARRRFLGRTVVEQAASPIGVSERSFAIGKDELGEDEVAAEE